MHDLLHELAQFVSTQECRRFVGDEMSMFLEIPKTIRHLSVETRNPEVRKKMERFKNLRTLHITNPYDSNLVDVLVEMFKVIRSVRLLHLNYSFELKIMPEEVGYLRHLRYLRFSVRNVNLLPRSLSSLYHLQFILFNMDYMNDVSIDYFPRDMNNLSNPSNDYFPRDMNNLSNLRVLSSNKFNFPGIGKLKFLQELRYFNFKNKNGFRIEELEHMNDLRYLNLTYLEEVRDAEEAYKAKLRDKRKLTTLCLRWNRFPAFNKLDNAVRDLAEGVLDNLQPHNHLKTLKIDNYMGARSAIWMNEAHLINNLEEIQLQHCMEWEILPPFGQLPFLKSLYLQNMRKVKRLENKFHWNGMRRCVFPSLETLLLTYMEALVDWFDTSVVDDSFPCLTRLYLSNCPNLQELPYLPPKLETLEIENIGWKTLNCKFIPLKTLYVRSCPNITSISLDVEIGKLEKLEIIDLPSLQFFPSSLANISSLKFLMLARLPQLQEYPERPPSLLVNP